MRILAIETSCDDTSIALVEANLPAKASAKAGFNKLDIKVLKNIVSSQTEIHRHFGGVVPNLAKRAHEKNLPEILSSLLASGYTLDPDLIAVTVGPGLEPALWAGIEFAKKLSIDLGIPLVGANHLEGHLYSNLLSPKKNAEIIFPAIALLVSGGHTILLLMKDMLHWKKLGETRDDAVGEAFDKVARILNLPYPGGPEIEKLALSGNPQAIKFPRPMVGTKDYNFSFSGLKTSVLYYLKDNIDPERSRGVSQSDIAASFQAAAVDVLTTKTMRAVREFGARSVLLCGGVAANQALRSALEKASQLEGANFFAPPIEYNTDNAAMIATAAFMRTLRKRKKLPIVANGQLSI